MRGHIVKRSKDSYSIVLNLGIEPATGKNRQKWVTVHGNKKAAERRLAELLHQLDTGMVVEHGRQTMVQFLERWLADYVRPNLAPRTVEGYEHIVHRYITPALGNVRLSRLKSGDLQRYYAGRRADGLSPQTVRHHHTLIHKALKVARTWGEVAINVADGVELPRAQRREMVVWNESQVSCFLATARRTPYYTLFYLALFTGMRRSELLGLQWSDVDLLLGQIRVMRGLHHLKSGEYVFTQPKSAKSRRTVALPPSATAVLREHWDTQSQVRRLRGGSLVFASVDGSPLRPNTITHAWPALAERCGVRRIRFHDARHTHATLMLQQGIHPKIVSERLGHSGIAITLDTYSHVSPGLQQAAAHQFDRAFGEGLVGKRWAELPEGTPIG